MYERITKWCEWLAVFCAVMALGCATVVGVTLL